MNQWFLYAAAGLAVLVIGLLGVFDGRSRSVRRILALNVMASGVFLIMVATARRNQGPPDPIPHALVLTGIVVSVSATGLALALAKRLAKVRDSRDTSAGADGPCP